jgi:hypothetical protein
MAPQARLLCCFPFNSRIEVMLQQIILHLARSPDHPQGCNDIGYEIIAPLDDDGRLDSIGWHARRSRCRVRRLAMGEPDRVGSLQHRAGGINGATWLFDFDPDSDSDDEPGYRLETHVFRPGEYVSIGDSKRRFRTFRVVEVRPLSARAA